MPGINPATYLTEMPSAAVDLATNTASAPQVDSEPPLKCYVTTSCPASGATATAAAAGAVAKAKPKCKRKKKHRASTSKRRACKKGKKKR
jgi:hypothetical protein